MDILVKAKKIQDKLELVENALETANDIIAKQIEFLILEGVSKLLDKNKTQQLQILIDILLKIKQHRNQEMNAQIDKLKDLSDDEIKDLMKSYIEIPATEQKENQ